MFVMMSHGGLIYDPVRNLFRNQSSGGYIIKPHKFLHNLERSLFFLRAIPPVSCLGKKIPSYQKKLPVSEQQHGSEESKVFLDAHFLDLH